MEKNCGNCTHWDFEGTGQKDGNRRQCLFALEKWRDDIPENHPMTTGDGSWYQAILFTMNTHYCSSWEKMQ